MDLQHIKSAYGAGGSFYRLNVPGITGEASQILFDIFNASGSNKTLAVLGVYAVPKGDVAVTGVVAIKVDLFRTSAVGTGGTAATLDGAVSTAATIVEMDTGNAALDANITARKEPTAGATADDWLSTAFIFSEETNAALYELQNLELLHAPVIIKQGQGISAVQGSVASVNDYGFIVDLYVV